MSEPARKLSEEGAEREARRPFSSFFKRVFGRSDDAAVESSEPRRSHEEPEPEEKPEEFWNPKEGSPQMEAVRPMRPQFPVWKKEYPGLTAEDIDLEDDDWLRHQSVDQNHPYSDAPPTATSNNGEQHPSDAQNPGFSTFPEEQRGGFVPSGDPYPPHLRKLEPIATMEPQPERQENLDAVVDRLLRDKDFLLAEELKHKAEEINQLLVQAQRQKMKVELSVSELESRPGNKVSWLDVRIFKEI